MLRLFGLAGLSLGAALLVAFLSGDEGTFASRDDPPSFRPPQPGYHSEAEIAALVDAWALADPARVEALELPLSAGGRRAPALVFGAHGADSTGVPLEERPTVFVVGGLDGRSLAGSEAALRATHVLLANLDTLRPDLTFVSIPWASPDGLADAAAGERAGAGRDARPIDDDEDGLLDEDGPDDLDGDGEVLDLLVEDPTGDWTFAEDPRFLVPAQAGDAPRLRRGPEGRDDDGDGQFNEDASGGVQLDAHFPVGWSGPTRSGAAGRFPLEDALARAIADEALARPTAMLLLFQGNHGGVARPGGTLAMELAVAVDAEGYDVLARMFLKSLGRDASCYGSLRERRQGERAGAAIDWFHDAVGALAIEVAPWGPLAVGRDGRPLAPEYERPGSPALASSNSAWARWLDDVRGGEGFAEWRPVELGTGRRAWVGGWRDRVDLDPPAELLGFALEGFPGFVREAADALPRLDLDVSVVERNGDLVRLRARVVNHGALATGRGSAGRPSGARERRRGEVVLRLTPPSEDALVAGVLEHEIGVLPGGGAGPEHDWLVLAPEGTTLRLEASAPGLVGATREVRP